VRVSRRQMVLLHHPAALRVLLLLRVLSYQIEIIACFIKTVKTLLKKLKTHRKGAKNAKKFKGKFNPITSHHIPRVNDHS
jgi:hypothetical protein